jgi:hypothetical protein
MAGARERVWSELASQYANVHSLNTVKRLIKLMCVTNPIYL